jgi:crotonobetainyl-CoA:carnitine CoA-transferase CaiB-like acyl-CoA transferase
VMANEQVVARGLIAEYDHPGIGRVRQAKPAAEFLGTPARAPSAAPKVGEHGDEILAELGYARADIDRLAESKVVRLSR